MKLFNTLSGSLEEFKSIKKNEVSLYTCGLTVYSQPHIGNWVAYIYWDLLVRALTASGYKVNRVQNITDVGHLTSDQDAGEDKMLKSALKEGLTAWEIAEKYIRVADYEAYTLLKLLRPDHMPRATNYIKEQILFVKQLEDKGFTYQLKDGLYFDSGKISNYGGLANLDIAGLRFGARVADTGKKNPTDFALWKLSNPQEKRDMEWDSPWGTGFPGWHLECSVMAKEILGSTIDIHTGGIDHIPVHHTNEIAQTEALTGKIFANFWLHANHLKINGTKISKSLGNIYTLQDALDKGYSIQAFKLLALSKHYRTEGNFSWSILESHQNRLEHWLNVSDLHHQAEPTKEKIDLLKYLKNDLDSPSAIANIDALFNKLHKNKQAPSEDMLTNIQTLLGINLRTADISPAQKRLIKLRTEARRQNDWQESDRIRNTLKKEGIRLEDSGNETYWNRLTHNN